MLVDWKMSDMDGLEATKAIRAQDRMDAKRVQIIALTDNAFDEAVQHSMQAGLNAHLSKPVEPEALFGTLEKLIGGEIEHLNNGKTAAGGRCFAMQWVSMCR